MLASCISMPFSGPVYPQRDVYVRLYEIRQEDMPAIQASAAANDPHAQYLLGVANEYGYGGSQNIPDAIKWYTQAAEFGHCAAQFRLARKYYFGDDVPRDYTQSYRWHEQLARQGHLYSIEALAGFYLHGEGVGKDRERARHWRDVAERLRERQPYSPEARAAWETPELACAPHRPGERLAPVPAPVEGIRLGGHDARIQALAFSRDGRRVFTASQGDETIFVWDSATGVKLSEVIVPGDPLHIGKHGERTLVRVPGKRAVPGRIDQGRWAPLLLAEGERIREVLFQSGVERVDMAGRKFWRDIETGDPLASIPPINGSPTGSALSPDRKRIVYGERDGVLHVWDVAGNRMERHIETRYPVWIMSIAYSPDGRYVAACGNNLSDRGITTLRNVRVWETETGREVRGFVGLDGAIAMAYLVKFSPDGKKLAAAGTDFRGEHVYLYEIEGGKELARYAFTAPEGGQAQDFVFSPDGKQIAVSYGFSVYLFTLP